VPPSAGSVMPFPAGGPAAVVHEGTNEGIPEPRLGGGGSGPTSPLQDFGEGAAQASFGPGPG
jgi:hypothetical protein